MIIMRSGHYYYNPNWTPEPKIYNKNYKETTVKTYANIIGRNLIGKRCSSCGKFWKGGKVDTHHKNHNVWDNRLENLQNLCRKCHQKVQFPNGKDYMKSKEYTEKMRKLMTGRVTKPEWYVKTAMKNSIIAKRRERNFQGKFLAYKRGGDENAFNQCSRRTGGR